MVISVICCVGAVTSAGVALADAQNGPATCKQISDEARRLACYDALFPTHVGPSAVKDSAAGVPQPAVSAKPGVAPTTPAAVMPEASAAAPATAPATVVPADLAAPVAASSAAATQQSFGAETLSRSADNDVSWLVAHIVGSVDGVPRGTVFQLDNGQIWHSVDDREYDYEGNNPAITIERNSFGNYWMHLDHAHFNLRVGRLK